MMKKLILLAPAICFVATGALNANAGVVVMRSSKEVPISNFPYEKGAWEAQLLAGAFWDPGLYDNRPQFDYAVQSLRLGYVVTNLTGGGLLRGDLEFLVEANGRRVLRRPSQLSRRREPPRPLELRAGSQSEMGALHPDRWRRSLP